MVAHYYQTCFCGLNIVFIVKLHLNSVLIHNFTIKTDFKFRFYLQYQNQFLISTIKSVPNLKCISNSDLSSKSIRNLNHKINAKVKKLI